MSSRLGNTGDTIRPNYRQVVFSITLNFPLVFTQDGLPELGTSFKETFLVAPFKKKSKNDNFSSYIAPRFQRVVRKPF